MVARQERKPQKAASTATTSAPSSTRAIVPASKPRLIRNAMPGMTKALKERRTVLMASMSIAAGCRWRGSELILLPGEIGDPVSRPGCDGRGELGDLVGPGGRVEDHGSQAELALQRAALGVHVLDARERHEGAPDPEDPTLQVHLVVPDLVAPPPPPEVGHHARERDEQRQRRQERQDDEQERDAGDAKQDPANERAACDERERPEGAGYAPEGLRLQVEPLCRFGLQGPRKK